MSERLCEACDAPLVRKLGSNGYFETVSKFESRRFCSKSCRSRRSRDWRFEDCYEVDASGCWLWKRAIATSGYGRIHVADGPDGYYQAYAHRYSWELINGPIPSGLQIDHLYRVRSCCNPAHLEVVTSAENNRRASKLTAQQAAVIRQRRAAGEKLGPIARDFSINEGHASRVARGLVWT